MVRTRFEAACAAVLSPPSPCSAPGSGTKALLNSPQVHPGPQSTGWRVNHGVRGLDWMKSNPPPYSAEARTPFLQPRRTCPVLCDVLDTALHSAALAWVTIGRLSSSATTPRPHAVAGEGLKILRMLLKILNSQLHLGKKIWKKKHLSALVSNTRSASIMWEIPNTSSLKSFRLPSNADFLFHPSSIAKDYLIHINVVMKPVCPLESNNLS